MWHAILWIILNLTVGMTMDFALFTQTTPSMKHASMLEKIIASEFWASIEWMFVIPANRIGYLFLTPAQLSLSSYVFDFIAQLISNKYWLGLETTLDDYVGMILILVGMWISKFVVCG